MSDIYLNIYDITIKISSDDKSLLSLAKENFSWFLHTKTNKPDIEMNFVYDGGNKKNRRDSGSDLIGATGATVSVKENTLCLMDFILPGLTMAITQLDGRYRIETSLKRGKRRFHLGKNFSDWESLNKLLRLAVIYPLFLQLKKKRNFDFLHGSTVESGGKGFVFVGLPGAGKTRCLMELFNNPAINFLSDNYVFLDERARLFAFPEMLKIDRGTNNKLLKRLPFEGAGKEFFKVDENRVKSEVTLDKIFLLSRSDKTQISRLDTEKFILDLESLEKFTKDFYELSYLGLLRLAKADTPGILDGRLDRLKKIFQGAKCYRLTIKENENNLNTLIGALAQRERE